MTAFVIANNTTRLAPVTNVPAGAIAGIATDAIAAPLAQAESAAATAVAISNYRPTLAQGVADFPVDAFFTSDETGSLRAYKRITAAPGYEDMGDGAAPVTLAEATAIQAEVDWRVSIRKFIPAGFATAVADATAHIQAALNSGAKVIEFEGLLLRCNEVTIPAGIELRSVNIQKHTAGGNVLLVNSDVRVTGRLRGTGTTSSVERGVYPAANAVRDVYLDLDVRNINVAVHAQPLAGTNLSDAPLRWKGRLHCEDIVGDTGESEGYGLLCSPAIGFDFKLTGKNIKRHLLYLSAGARQNRVDVDCDGCGNYVVQLMSYAKGGSDGTSLPVADQPATIENNVRVKARNLWEDVAGQSGVVAIAQNAHDNIIVLDGVQGAMDGPNGDGVGGTAPAPRAAIVVEGTGYSANASRNVAYPRGNKIIDGSVTGRFSGAYVIDIINADGSIIRGNSVKAIAAVGAIRSTTTGVNNAAHGGQIVGNSIDLMGQSLRGIYAEVTHAETLVGANDIRNNNNWHLVEDQTVGRLRFEQSQARKYVTGPGTLAPKPYDARYWEFRITGDNYPNTIGAPPAINAVNGMELVITIKNTTTAADMGATTWAAAYKMAAWTNPAKNFQKTIGFRFNGVNWVETSRSGDVPV